MHRLLILCAVSLLAGCTTMADKLHGSLTPPSGQGYAIVSMTVRTHIPEQASASLRWLGLDNRQQGTLYTNFATDTVFGAEGMSPVEGKLQLLPLPPGHYQLQDAYASWNDGDRDNGVIPSQRYAHFVLGKTFDIRAGETVYLGEVRFNLDLKPDVELGDAQRRDYGHMQRVWKVNDLSSIAHRPFSDKIGRSY